MALNFLEGEWIQLPLSLIFFLHRAYDRWGTLRTSLSCQEDQAPGYLGSLLGARPCAVHWGSRAGLSCPCLQVVPSQLWGWGAGRKIRHSQWRGCAARRGQTGGSRCLPALAWRLPHREHVELNCVLHLPGGEGVFIPVEGTPCAKA